MVRLAFAALGAGLLAVLVAADGRASLHHPEDQTGVVGVDDAGAPEPFPFDEFRRRRVITMNACNADWPLEQIDPQTKEKVIDPNTGKPYLSDRGVLDARIKKALAKPEKARTPEEKAALAVDYLRFSRPDDAEGALKGQRSDFLANVTLAHIAATQGQWARAYEFLDIANEEAANKRKPLTAVHGMSGAKLAWQLKMNRGPLLKLVKLRMAEAREEAALKAKKPPEKRPVEDELPDRIFDVNFVNDAGQYEPGKLAAAEKAKFPGGDFTEALATVQQLVLWFPNDVRLYWLLGELYAARGDVERGDLQAAKAIMDECVESGRFSNRKALMQHRDVVTKLANVEPVEEPPAALPFSWRTVRIYFGVIGAIVLYALGRKIWKATRGGK